MKHEEVLKTLLEADGMIEYLQAKLGEEDLDIRSRRFKETVGCARRALNKKMVKVHRELAIEAVLDANQMIRRSPDDHYSPYVSFAVVIDGKDICGRIKIFFKPGSFLISRCSFDPDFNPDLNSRWKQPMKCPKYLRSDDYSGR